MAKRLKKYTPKWAEERAEYNEYALPNRLLKPLEGKYNIKLPLPYLGTWLTQALQKPVKSKYNSDYRNWETTEEGVEQIIPWTGYRELRGFDLETVKKFNEFMYFRGMGAAEYEMGGIYKSWQTLQEHYQDLVFVEATIEGFPFYIICHKDSLSHVHHGIRRLIVNNQFEKYRMNKTNIYLDEVLSEKRFQDFIGGWVFESNFLFFTVKEPFEKFRRILQEAKHNG